MTVQPSPAIGQTQVAQRDDQPGGEMMIITQQGGDDHLRERAMRADGHQGGVMRARHQGGAVIGDHLQRSHPLKEFQAVQRDWLRNFWKHQV